MKLTLKLWAKEEFHATEKDVLIYKNKWEEIQKILEQEQATQELLQEEKNEFSLLHNAMKAKEEIQWLKSESLWLSVGDGNTKNKIYNQFKMRLFKNNVKSIQASG